MKSDKILKSFYVLELSERELYDLQTLLKISVAQFSREKGADPILSRANMFLEVIQELTA